MTAATVVSFADAVNNKPSASIVYVTPEMARRWLDRNDLNRGIRTRTVQRYARDMQRGRWELTGEAVKFSIDGALLDGQHRLAAVVESGSTVPMFVVRGLNPDSQTVMDTGVKRTGSDAMQLRGEKNRAALAATIRLALLYDSGKLVPISGDKGGRPQVSNAELLDYLDAHPDIRVFVDQATSIFNRVDVHPSALALAMWVLHRVDAAAAVDFFNDLANLTGLQPGDPILALHNRLADIRRSRRRVEAQDFLSLIFRAWNARRDGKQLYRVPLESRNGRVTMPVPR